MIKRIFDIVLSINMIIFLFPLLVIIGILIKLDSKGPVIFKQVRVGKNSMKFDIYKFRSMKIDSQKNDRSPTDSNDARLTKIGKVIRKLSLDELPQIFNVLKGEMSFIGPRAITEEEINLRIKKYIELTNQSSKKVEEMYIVRQSVSPGITGLTQVSGRSGAGVVKATELDYLYVKNLSILQDFSIIWKTVRILFNRKGAN